MRVQQPLMLKNDKPSDHSYTPERISMVHGPIIVGAGPSGLAVAATLRLLSVPFLVLERSNCIADLWHHRTYERLSLHLPKAFCQLPHLPFPSHFPTYPSKDQFLHYLHSYADHFSIHPLFGSTVVSAHFDHPTSLWHVIAVQRYVPDEAIQSSSPSQSSFSLSESSNSTMSSCSCEPMLEAIQYEVVEYVSPWLVVAAGENAEPVVPKLKGTEAFEGSMLHSSEYTNGLNYNGKKVLVLGCGNSGMEMCLDLTSHGAKPLMSVRSGVHVLPREMLGSSIFGLTMKLLKWLPIKLVDKFLLLMAKMILGDTEKYGLKRPKMGPIELKNKTGKTPVLDFGALNLIKTGKVKIVPEVMSFTSNGAKFVDGAELEFDCVVFATGYRSNVPFWLKDCDSFSVEGKPKTPFPNDCNCMSKNGLYFVGFTGKGLLGASVDAMRAASDISKTVTRAVLSNSTVSQGRKDITRFI